LSLGNVLGCPHCKERFTAKLDGRLVKVVRDRQGRWVDTEWVASRSRALRGKWLRVAGVMAAVGVLAYCLTWTPRLVESLKPAPGPEAGLPVELEPRAERFARAWLKGDVPAMRQLTDPVQDRMLFAWYKRNPPPAASNPETGADGIKVAVEPVPGKPSAAALRVRFESASPSPASGPLELQLSWQERDGNWVFQPVPDLKLQVGM
jgi:hypothetical protein